MRSFCTSWSISSCAPASSSVPSREIAFDVGVEEGRDAADRHGRAVRLLDGAEIGEVGPLHGLARGLGRTGDVTAVAPPHLGEFGEGAHLFGQLLATADDVVGRPHIVDLGRSSPLDRQQAVDAIEGDAAVVADDPAAAIGVGQTGDDAGSAASQISGV